MELETRATFGIELKEDSGKVTIGGLAAPYRKRSELLYGWFTEEFLPGAFEASIRERNIVYLVGHDQAQPVAMTKNSTLQVDDRSDGLYTKVQPNGTTYAQDLLINVREGVVAAQSVGILVEDDEWIQDKKTGAIHREIRKAELYEVSAVVWPAYPQTDVSAVRSRFEGSKKSQESRERQRKFYEEKIKLAKRKQVVYS